MSDGYITATGNLRLIRSSDLRAKISMYYETLRRQLARVEACHTDYVSFVHTIVPGKMRDNMDLESVETFGVEFALRGLVSDAFRSVFNQEYNAMLFYGRYFICGIGRNISTGT